MREKEKESIDCGRTRQTIACAGQRIIQFISFFKRTPIHKDQAHITKRANLTIFKHNERRVATQFKGRSLHAFGAPNIYTRIM